MRRPRSVNPTVRGFAIIFAIVCVVMIFQLYATLMVVSALLQIAFFLAIAFFLFMFWRDHRYEIGNWPARSRWVFYGSILIVLVNLGVYFGSRFAAAHSLRVNGLIGVAWLLVFPLCGYAIWRVWRDERSYR